MSQSTLNKSNFSIVEDERLGSETIRSLNQVVDLRKFIKIFVEERLNYYLDLKNLKENRNE